MKHPGHTYGGFVPTISKLGMTLLLLEILVAMGILPHRPIAIVIVISNGRGGITHAHCYFDHYIYRAIILR
jgi:hypothetical protein